MQDVRLLDRQVAEALRAGHAARVELELRECAVELAVACNVVELSPMHRIVAGSTVHLRMLHALDRLASALRVELHEAA